MIAVDVDFNPVQDARMEISLGQHQANEAIPPLVAAFWDYPETIHLLPDERRRRHVLPRYLLSDARDAARFDLLLGAHVDGHVVGAAAWTPSGAHPMSLERQLAQLLDLCPALPWGLRTVREAQRGRGANRARHPVHPEHYYLRVVGIDPRFQGRGLESSLIRLGGRRRIDLDRRPRLNADDSVQEIADSSRLLPLLRTPALEAPAGAAVSRRGE